MWKAYLISALSVKVTKFPFNSLQEFSKSGYGLIVKGDSLFETMFKDSAEGTTMKQVYDEIISTDDNSLVNSFEESVKSVLENKNYATVTEHFQMKKHKGGYIYYVVGTYTNRGEAFLYHGHRHLIALFKGGGEAFCSPVRRCVAH